MNRLRIVSSILLSVVFLSALSASAELRFARHFGEAMVLQQDKPLTISGMADAGAKVSVTFAGQSGQVTADDQGAWFVVLPPVAANAKPQWLTAKSKGKTVSVKDVLVGDVILFARQTSIDVSLGKDAAGKKIASMQKASPMFRAISIATIPNAKPQADLAPEATQGWAEVNKDTALAMSAAAYYLGRDLAEKSKVPIGIIDINMGSAFPISWLSREALMETEKFFGDKEVMGQVAWHDKMLEAEAAGVPMKKQKVPPSNTVHRTLFPSGGHNAVLHPLQGIALKAALVQLGNDYPYMLYAALEEDGTQFDRVKLNTCYVETYNIRKVGFRMESKTAPRIAREWRKVLGEETLPFGLIVPPGSDLNTLGQHHREMRELQRLVAEDTPGVSVILPGTEHVRYSAQPADEVVLATRCLSWLQGGVYSTPGVPATGPMFDRIEANFNKAVIYFKKGTTVGLKAAGSALEYFEVAGVEGDYFPAEARIEGETIQLESDTVNRIMRVRYNWNKHPNQQLVNAGGLPAMPFRSERLDYHWFVTNADDDLPEEYFTPANEWKKSDVTLINAQLKTHGYGNFTGWIGPAGFRTGPFGPNMGVREVKKGSPAFGKLFVGDTIYSANGNMLGDKAWEVMGAAITESETIEGDGKLVLGVRRGTENIDMVLDLEVMGSYSPTAPFDCPKTEKIIGRLEEIVVADGASAGFLNNDAIFMLATGSPDLQGYVRRLIYGKNNNRDPNRPIDTSREGKSWHNSADAFLMGEYYLATGDRNALPHLEHACARLVATQNAEYGGWRQNYPGGATYGLIPNAGLPGVMGMHFAREAGVKVDPDGFAKAIKHYSGGKAETGFLIYGYGECRREIPKPFDPDIMANGKMDSFNGGISAAGILMGFVENHRAAHLCSMISAYSYNNTFGGHGGNFWNNFWTPLGAHQHSKKAFINFWQGHRWYRECSRMYDGRLIGGGRESAAYGVALVAPRERIQIVGAPRSPFAVNPPEGLKPALKAYWDRDYAGAERLVGELIASGEVGKDDMPTVEYMLQQTRDIQASIDADLKRMAMLAEAGNPNEAKTFVAGLQGILAEGDERLAAIQAKIASAKQLSPQDVATADDPDDEPEDADAALKKAEEEAAAAEEARLAAAAQRKWVRLVSERFSGDGKKAAVESRPESANVWKIRVVEDMSQAPEGWTEPTFDDSGWKETELPISWRMYHTALLRTTFDVEDKTAYDLLRLYAWVFRQQGIEIYLNGEIIGKVNNIEKKTGDIQNDFNESAMKHLRNGENTLAVTTRHNWRWGMLFMKVYNDGFDFNLDARLSD